MKERIDRLRQEGTLPKQELVELLTMLLPEDKEYLTAQAYEVRQEQYGNTVYIRGLIELTNYCKNDCYYCGIRRSNDKAERYRLSKAEILDCCAQGYALGFRTFVLQGGEDPYYTDALMVDIISAIKANHPDCALTLSLGEKPRESYEQYKKAGADRYLLRHETANPDHYAHLHPPELTLAQRKDCLYALKELGFQVGTGFMVGSPGQTAEDLAEDLLFIKQLAPHMIGMGPYIPHKDTPFGGEAAGDVEQTLLLLSILRLMNPGALLPATTALGTLHPHGRELGMAAGANVVMPNLSPTGVRDKYTLYDNKLTTGCEAAEALEELKSALLAAGFVVVVDRGDAKSGSF